MILHFKEDPHMNDNPRISRNEKMLILRVKAKKQLRLTPAYLLGIIWTVFTVVMIGWIILASFSTTREIFTGKLLSSGLHFENYKTALIRNKQLRSLLNSVIYTVPSCILTLLISAPAAYCLAKFTFRMNSTLQKISLICMSIPNIMLVMPLFAMISKAKLSGSHFTLILLYTGTALPYTTFFLITFFKGISNTFIEAATIDGCSPVGCFWRIMFPLAQPALVTITIFNFIRFWNEYFFALVFANKASLRPVGVALYQIVYSMMNTGDWSGLFCSVVIVFVPTVVIYIFLSDKIVSGVTAGGIKG